MNDTILYQEKQPYHATFVLRKGGVYYSPAVTVTAGGLKVNNDFYRLDAVTAITEESCLERNDPGIIYGRIGLWILFWLLAILGIVTYSLQKGGQTPATFMDIVRSFSPCGIALIFALRGSMKDKKNWSCSTHVLLSKPGNTTKVCIAFYPPRPEHQGSFAPSGDYSEKLYRERLKDYQDSMDRIKAITDALGLAIQQHV